MFRTSAAILLALTAACAGREGTRDAASAEYRPLIVISFRGTGVTAEVPWTVPRGGGGISAAAVIRREEDGRAGYGPVLEEALEKGMLVALVSDTVTGQFMGQDNMHIRVDPDGGVHAVPPELLAQLPSSMDLDSVKSHRLLLELCDLYKPDLVILDTAPRDHDVVLDLAAHWTSPDVLSRYRVVLYSLQGDSRRRGWCIFAGRGINGATPFGVTVPCIFTTIRLLAGLDWLADLPRSVPAVSVLEDPRIIWRDR